jgi:hypothetical protein
MNIVVPNLSLLAIAAALKTAPLDGGSLRLFKNDLNPTPTTLLADLTLCDFSGYANKTIATWNAPYIDASGAVVSLAGLEVFTCSGAGVSNSVYGAYYLDAGGALVWVARFDDAPVPMAVATDALPFVPRFIFGQIPPG